MSAHVLDVTPEEYRSDPLPVPSLNQSVAHTLVSRSPAHAYLQHPKLGGVPVTVTPVMDAGSLLHRLVLGAGSDIAVVNAYDWRTKVAKQERELARTEKRIPCLKRHYDSALALAETVHGRLRKMDITLSGQSEVCIAWDEPSSRGPVSCRGMLDHVIVDLRQATIYDLKTCKDSSPRAIGRSAVDNGHDIQGEAYRRAIEALHPELCGRVDVVFIYVETEPPHCVTAARPDGVMRELGLSKWRRAVELWARCLAENSWPGYATEIVPLEAPPWALSGEMLLDSVD